jgi:hypothetical protein
VKIGIQNLIKHWIPVGVYPVLRYGAGMTTPKDPLFPLFFKELN